MKTRIVLLGLLLTATLHAPAAQASDAIDKGCKALGVFVSATAGYTVGASLAKWASAGLAAVGHELGSAPIQKACDNYFSYFRTASIDYEKFVEDHCDGNPLWCPNGYNSTGGLPPDPEDCLTFIVCSFALAVHPDGSLSVQDVLNAGAFVDISVRSGYWDFYNYGYLVGLPPLGMVTMEP